MTDEPLWLTADIVARLHNKAIETSGGSEGIRDRSLLESAVARPMSLYVHAGVEDRFELAASYAEGIVQNHPFVDGNKRTAFLAAALFLSLHGRSLDERPSALHTHKMVALANKFISRAEFAQHLEAHSFEID